MQDYNTIIGVIQMRQNNCSFSVIQARYHIGSSTTQLILQRFKDAGRKNPRRKTIYRLGR